jgi:hypothetical protein
MQGQYATCSLVSVNGVDGSAVMCNGLAVQGTSKASIHPILRPISSRQQISAELLRLQCNAQCPKMSPARNMQGFCLTWVERPHPILARRAWEAGETVRGPNSIATSVAFFFCVHRSRDQNSSYTCGHYQLFLHPFTSEAFDLNCISCLHIMYHPDLVTPMKSTAHPSSIATANPPRKLLYKSIQHC